MSSVRIRPLLWGEIDGPAAAAAAYPNLPYTGYPEVRPADAAGQLGAELRALLEGDGVAFLAERDGRPAGLAAGRWPSPVPA